MNKLLARVFAFTEDGVFTYKEKGERKPVPWREVTRLVVIVCSFALVGFILYLAYKASPIVLMVAIGALMLGLVLVLGLKD